MANPDNPSGLTPVDDNGGDYTGPTRLYFAPSGYGTDLFIGDPLTITGTSNTAVVRDHGIGTMPEVNITVVGSNHITCVMVGIEPINQDSAVYGVASTERVLHCVDAPNTIFEIQADGAVPAATIGLNAILIATNAGSTATGISGFELDSGTATAPNTTVGFQLKILRAVDRLDNDTTITNPKILVLINAQTNATGTVGIN